MSDGIAEGWYSITGHWSADVLYGNNGEQISAAAINFHDDTFDGIKSYQFIQEKPGVCILHVVPLQGSLSDNDYARIQRGIRKKLGAAVACEVRCVPDIELSGRGKYKMVLQKCQKKEDKS